MAYVYTENLDRALRVAEALETGMVGVNRGVISDAAAPSAGSRLRDSDAREGTRESTAFRYEIRSLDALGSPYDLRASRERKSVTGMAPAAEAEEQHRQRVAFLA